MGRIFTGGHEFLCRLCEALGIDKSQHVSRIVLDVAVDDVARVYVQRFLPSAQDDAVLAAVSSVQGVRFFNVAGVSVDEKGTVVLDVPVRMIAPTIS